MCEVIKWLLKNSIKGDLVLNPKPEDCDFFIPSRFIFLPPDEICLNIFKMLLETEKFSFEELESIERNAALDLFFDEYYFYGQTKYSKEDSLKYYLELIYWTCAYKVKKYPKRCTEDLLKVNWFERSKNRIELVRENRSATVLVEALETHEKTEINGWSLKY